MGARIAAVATHLPSRFVSSGVAEAKLAERSPGFRPPPGIIERATGIRGRHVAPSDWQASDLAVAAAAKLLADTGLEPGDLDLLIFGSASQDLAEPATAHIVSAALGATCPVFDLKNACNSVLNAIEVADALIGVGRYRRVLICSGETPSRATRWQVRDLTQLARSFAGYTLSDGGAALLLEPGGPDEGVLAQRHVAHSAAWPAGTLPGGGSRHPRDVEHSYFDLDGPRLRAAFDSLGPEPVQDTLTRCGIGWDHLALVGVHQVTLPYLRAFTQRCAIPDRLVEVTVVEHGNCASVSLPLQLDRAVSRGSVERGDLVALIGLAGGVSLSTLVLRW